jgi:hypothetical protein
MGFQAIGGRASFDFDAPAPAHGQSRLAFFGRVLDGESLRARVAACRAHGRA